MIRYGKFRSKPYYVGGRNFSSTFFLVFAITYKNKTDKDNLSFRVTYCMQEEYLEETIGYYCERWKSRRGHEKFVRSALRAAKYHAAGVTNTPPNALKLSVDLSNAAATNISKRIAGTDPSVMKFNLETSVWQMDWFQKKKKALPIF